MIALITPTGGRARQFSHCVEYMQRQDYAGEVLWVIVNDVTPPTVLDASDFKPNWRIIQLYPVPVWKPGQNTQSRNLLAAVGYIKHVLGISSVFIIEDDDWYAPTYLSMMTEALKGFEIVGEKNTCYYNVLDFSLKDMKNRKHSSLFQTGFTLGVLPEFERILKTKVKFIDVQLFKSKRNINLIPSTGLSIGIKGQPGRPGIGVGHKTKPGSIPSMSEKIKQLQILIGEDYAKYL